MIPSLVRDGSKHSPGRIGWLSFGYAVIYKTRSVNTDNERVIATGGLPGAVRGRPERLARQMDQWRLLAPIAVIAHGGVAAVASGTPVGVGDGGGGAHPAAIAGALASKRVSSRRRVFTSDLRRAGRRSVCCRARDWRTCSPCRRLGKLAGGTFPPELTRADRIVALSRARADESAVVPADLVGGPKPSEARRFQPARVLVVHVRGRASAFRAGGGRHALRAKARATSPRYRARRPADCCRCSTPRAIAGWPVSCSGGSSSTGIRMAVWPRARRASRRRANTGMATR
jgi:hypothetical protein